MLTRKYSTSLGFDQDARTSAKPAALAPLMSKVFGKHVKNYIGQLSLGKNVAVGRALP